MKSLSACGVPGRRVLLVLTVLLILPVTAALAAVTPRTIGGYVTSTHSPKNVGFTVIKRGRQFQVFDVQISCEASTTSYGSVALTARLTISKTGTFSYSGPVQVYKNSRKVAPARLELLGKFASAVKVIGRATLTHSTLTGCPPAAFTARWVPSAGS
jgi:hypothetical protein